MGDKLWRLYYWGYLPGRGEFIRLIFEDCGVPFEEVGDPETLKENGFFTGVVPPEEIKIPKGWQNFALPCLQRLDTGFRLSQTPVICRYLGKQLGRFPTSEEDQLHAEQINLTVHDYITEGRLSFHGKNFYASHYIQREETQPYIDYFKQTRLPRFLNHFEQVLKLNESKGVIVGDKVTYVDLALLHVLRATKMQFPDSWEQMTPKTPLLAAFKERMEGRERLKEYFSSSRCRPFLGDSMT